MVKNYKEMNVLLNKTHRSYDTIVYQKTKTTVRIPGHLLGGSVMELAPEAELERSREQS